MSKDKCTWHTMQYDERLSSREITVYTCPMCGESEEEHEDTGGAGA